MSRQGFILFAVTIPFLLPVFVSAVTPGTVPGYEELGLPRSPVRTAGGLQNVISGIVSLTYRIFFVVAVLFIILAAFNYLTGAGTPDKLKKARDMIVYAAVAIAIALLAVSINVVIRRFLANPREGGTSLQGTYFASSLSPRENG